MNITVVKTLKDKRDKHLFAAIQMTCKARGSHHARYELRYLYVEGEYICSTDGRRIYYYKGKHILENGFYEPLKATKKQIILMPVEADLRFPNFKDIIPKEVREPVVLPKMDYGWFAPIYRLTTDKTPEGVTVGYNMTFLRDALLYDDTGELYDSKLYVPKSTAQPIRITYDVNGAECSAVIMPVNMQPPPSGKCKDCRWWKDLENKKYGLCRRKCPIVAYCTSPDYPTETEWPWTEPDDWCGELEKRGE